MVESLRQKYTVFSKVVAPQGWKEGMDIGRSKKSSYPLLALYWTSCLTVFLALVAVVVMTLPYAFMVDPLEGIVLEAVLGFFAVASLASILFPVGVIIATIYTLRVASIIVWKIKVRSIASHLSTYVGVAGVVGFLSAAMAPLVFTIGGSENVLSSSIMFDGSVLLKFPAAFGVAGLLFGLCTVPCHIVGGIDNIVYRNVAPVLLFDALVAGSAFKLRIDPFDLCLMLSERYLRDHSFLVTRMDKISEIEVDGFVQDHLPIVVAKSVMTLEASLHSLRMWYVVVVVLVSIIGMCVSVWRAIYVECGIEKQ
jgi:membrane protein